ncbi:MAG: hypothetical protein HY721_01860 [Planctomycetes bacterium]|nr:hypothetical protein [Planctomycetota bacterium]
MAAAASGAGTSLSRPASTASRKSLTSSPGPGPGGRTQSRLGRGVNASGAGRLHMPMGSSGSRSGAVQGGTSAQTAARGRCASSVTAAFVPARWIRWRPAAG